MTKNRNDKKTTVLIDEKLHNQMKAHCASSNMSIRDFINVAIGNYIEYLSYCDKKE